MKQFAKKSLVLFIALFFTAALSAKTPKYIFYCIGDGMSFAHCPGRASSEGFILPVTKACFWSSGY